MAETYIGRPPAHIGEWIKTKWDAVNRPNCLVSIETVDSRPSSRLYKLGDDEQYHVAMVDLGTKSVVMLDRSNPIIMMQFNWDIWFDDDEYWYQTYPDEDPQRLRKRNVYVETRDGYDVTVYDVAAEDWGYDDGTFSMYACSEEYVLQLAGVDPATGNINPDRAPDLHNSICDLKNAAKFIYLHKVGEQEDPEYDGVGLNETVQVREMMLMFDDSFGTYFEVIFDGDTPVRREDSVFTILPNAYMWIFGVEVWKWTGVNDAGNMTFSSGDRGWRYDFEVLTYADADDIPPVVKNDFSGEE